MLFVKVIKPGSGRGILIPHSRSLFQDNPVSGERLYPKNLFFSPIPHLMPRFQRIPLPDLVADKSRIKSKPALFFGQIPDPDPSRSCKQAYATLVRAPKSKLRLRDITKMKKTKWIINILNVTWHSSCSRASKTNQRRSQECE